MANLHTLLSAGVLPCRNPWPQSQCHSLPCGSTRELCPGCRGIHLHCWPIKTLEWIWADFFCCIDRGWQLHNWLKHTSCNNIDANIAGWKIHIWYYHTVLCDSATYTHCTWHCWCGLTVWVQVYVMLCTVTASSFILNSMWRNLFSTIHVLSMTVGGSPMLSPYQMW